MSLFSMTGFGSGAFTAGCESMSCEISTVNRKQLEIRFTMPGNLAGFETELRKRVQSSLSRGMVSVRIVHTSSSANAAAIDFDRARAIAAAAKKLGAELGISGELSAAELLNMPGVMSDSILSGEASEDEKKAAMGALDAALTALATMRKREGAALAEELKNRLALLKELREQLLPEVGGIEAQIKQRLMDKLAESHFVVDLQDERLLKEVLFYADKADVTEELTRLASHFQQFDGFLSGVPGGGRSMDFLLQEMFREITTLGNKAGSGAVAQIVVRFKSELEKIREQVQNVE